MLKNKEKEILKNFRKITKKEIFKKKIKAPAFSIQCDYRTKKLKLNYSFSKYVGLDKDKKKKYIKQQRDFYLNDVTLDNKEIFLNNLENYIQLLIKKIKEQSEISLSIKDRSIEYWADLYTSSLVRSESVKKTSIKGDKEALKSLIDYCYQYKKDMLKVWEWPKNGKEFIYNYMKYKQLKKNDNKKPWSNGTVLSNYQRLRAFFNWLSIKIDPFPSNVIGGLIFQKDKKVLIMFKDNEIRKVKNFIDKNKKSNKWGWFIEMLVVMLETGARTQDLCQLKIENLDIKEKSLNYTIQKRKNKINLYHPLSDYCWSIIFKLIFKKNNILRTDKKIIFHHRFFRNIKNKDSKIESLLVEDLHKGFSPNGFRKKFNDMVVFLNLSSHLTPQACRSFYILEMLKKTKGDISLVSKRIGISSKIIVENYIPYLNVKSNNEIIDLFSSENIETKTKTKRLQGGGVSVPFMITREMFRELILMGYNEKEIGEMKSEDAHELIINS